MSLSFAGSHVVLSCGLFCVSQCFLSPGYFVLSCIVFIFIRVHWLCHAVARVLELDAATVGHIPGYIRVYTYVKSIKTLHVLSLD